MQCLGIVPVAHETIEYTQSKNKAQQIDLVSIEQKQPTRLKITTICLKNELLLHFLQILHKPNNLISL